ncbi:Phosphoglycolate phosphatase 2, partial [Dichanthelium oligosanthes]
GKKLVFVTNNSRKSRRQYSKKFRSLGLEVTEEEIFTSSFAAAMFLKLNNFPPEKKVYVVGEDGILEELKLAGFECFGGPEDGKKNILLEADFYFEHDKSVMLELSLLDLISTSIITKCSYCSNLGGCSCRYARTCISENPGCLFIATNRDPTGHMTSAQEWPGAGTMVAAVSCSVQKEPIVVGKPSSFLMDFLLKRFAKCNMRNVVLPYQNCRTLRITFIQISTRIAYMISLGYCRTNLAAVEFQWQS